MFQLIYKNRYFQNLEDFKLLDESEPEFLKDALTFCKEWLEGNESFAQKTSGSTGSPKTIFIQRKSMEASAKGTEDFFQVSKEEVLFCCLNPAYIAGKMMLVRSMEWQVPVILQEPSSNPLLGYPFPILPTFIALVPMQMEVILANPETSELVKNIPHIILGGAPVNFRLKKSIIKNGISAFQTFGMTETVSHFALAPLRENELLYTCLPGVSIGTDERETLWVKSPMSGPEPIQTNDLVEIENGNSFRWLGRADFVINSGGVKLHPELVEAKAENVIEKFFPKSRFFFAGVPDQTLGEKLVLFIEKETQKPEISESLIQELSLQLDKYEKPKEIVFRAKFVETPSGKINRKAIIQ
jgi:O-succinylbenzoic acid--CoA ligase